MLVKLVHPWVKVRSLCTYHEGIHKGADKSLARPTSRCILFEGENISFDASLVYV